MSKLMVFGSGHSEQKETQKDAGLLDYFLEGCRRHFPWQLWEEKKEVVQAL